MSSRVHNIQQDAMTVDMVTNLTDIFESIASMRIKKIKDRVAASEVFFAELWQIYTQLRVNPKDQLAAMHGPRRDKPNIYVVITSEGGLSGDIDRQIVQTVLKSYNATSTDLIVIGAHGALQFSQHGVHIKRYFKIPDIDQAIDISPIIQELLGYKNPTIWFQHYTSLVRQDVGRLNLLGRVRSLGNDTESEHETGPIISPHDYLFEPSVDAVVQYLEGIMMEVALSQVILESRLAQYASRFNAMSAAKKRAKELQTKLTMTYNQAKRGEADDRIKEIMGAMQALGVHGL